MGNWAYTTDFTYRDSVLENPGQMMANFIASHWLDVSGLVLDGAWKELEVDECDELTQACYKLGVFGALPGGLVSKANNKFTE